MERKFVDILAACFAGGVTTTVLALVGDVGPLGLAVCALAGALAGYLTCRYRMRDVWEFAKANVPSAWRWATNPLTPCVWLVGVVVFWPGLVAFGSMTLWIARESDDAVRPYFLACMGGMLLLLCYSAGAVAVDVQTVGQPPVRAGLVEAFGFVWKSVGRPVLRWWFSSRPFAVAAMLAREFWTSGVEAFVLIHRRTRIACMVDGPLGGVVAYGICRAAVGEALPGGNPVIGLAIVLAGGVLGLALGYVSHRLVMSLPNEATA